MSGVILGRRIRNHHNTHNWPLASILVTVTRTIGARRFPAPYLLAPPDHRRMILRR